MYMSLTRLQELVQEDIAVVTEEAGLIVAV
jgi:hypothetical protein